MAPMLDRVIILMDGNFELHLFPLNPDFDTNTQINTFERDNKMTFAGTADVFSNYRRYA